jgi:hypothetical protein
MDVILEAARRRKRDNASTLITAICILVLLVAYFALQGFRQHLPLAMWVALFGLLVAGLAYSSYNSRCPSCNTGLGADLRRANFCPHCGVRLKADASTRGDGA